MPARNQNPTVHGPVDPTAPDRDPVDRVYVSAPLKVTRSPRWDTALEQLRTRLPGAVLLLPTALFHTRLDWRRRFPQVLRDATRLVFLTDPHGWIGRGVHEEITQAAALNRPVTLLTPSGTLVPLADLELVWPNENDWTRYCHVSLRGAPRASGASIPPASADGDHPQ